MKAPWFKFYYKDVVLELPELTLEQRGMYLSLMVGCYNNGGPLRWPDDKRLIFWLVGSKRQTHIVKLLSELNAAGFIHQSDTGEIIPLGFSLARRGRKPAGMRTRRRILERDGGKCRECGSEEHLAIDHIVPISLGGHDYEDNLQVLCRSCNSRKRNGTR